MASAIDTESTLTTEPENLTKTHGQSGLKTTHSSRRTKSGFVVTHNRLPGYEPSLPTKHSGNPSDSWIWEHGERITRKKGSQECWMCRTCYNDTVRHPLGFFIKPRDPTTLAQRHMKKQHGYTLKGEKVQGKKRKRQDTDVRDGLSAQQPTNNTVFDTEGWRQAYVRWSVSTGQSLRQTANDDHKDLLTFQNPRLNNLVPTSPDTARAWIIQAYKTAKKAGN